MLLGEVHLAIAGFAMDPIGSQTPKWHLLTRRGQATGRILMQVYYNGVRLICAQKAIAVSQLRAFLHILSIWQLSGPRFKTFADLVQDLECRKRRTNRQPGTQFQALGLVGTMNWALVDTRRENIPPFMY